MESITRQEQQALFKQKIRSGLSIDEADWEVKRDVLYVKNLNQDIKKLQSLVRSLRNENLTLSTKNINLQNQLSELKKKLMVKDISKQTKSIKDKIPNNPNIFYCRRIVSVLEEAGHPLTITELIRLCCTTNQILHSCLKFLQDFRIIKSNRDYGGVWRYSK